MGSKQIMRGSCAAPGRVDASVNAFLIMRVCGWGGIMNLIQNERMPRGLGYAFPVYLVNMKLNPGRGHWMDMKQMD